MQCVAVCCSVLQCVAVRMKRNCPKIKAPVFDAVCCSVLQWVAVGCRVLQCVAVCCSVLQCVCSVLQCAAVRCSVLQHTSARETFALLAGSIATEQLLSHTSLMKTTASVRHLAACSLPPLSPPRLPSSLPASPFDAQAKILKSQKYNVC